MKVIHHCSVQGLLGILQAGAYHPKYPSPNAADSGLNCYIDGRNYRDSIYEGQGAELHFDWDGEVREGAWDDPFPLEPNVLHNQGNFRAIIPAGTDKQRIKAVDFEVVADSVSWREKWALWRLKQRIAKGPIYIDLYHKWI